MQCSNTNKDIPLAIKTANMWHDSEPASILVVFENSEHLANMDVPDRFNDTLHQFLTGRRISWISGKIKREG